MDLNTCLKVTPFFDFDHPSVRKFVVQNVFSPTHPKKAAIELYYAVRDGFPYNPYLVAEGSNSLKASYCVEKGSGYCLTKAVLLGAAMRSLGVPARLGLADVVNHLSSPKLVKWLGSELFVMHGFVEIFIDGNWVKATPAFNKQLCQKFGVAPLDFDGKNDSVFQENTQDGRRYMEFVTHHGSFDDVPVQLISDAWAKQYPHLPRFK